MKNSIFVVYLMLCATSLAQSVDVSNKKKSVVAHKPPTHKDIAKIQRKQALAKAEIRKSPLKPIVTIKKHSLIGNSTLLASSRYWTLVPKGSVIHIPTHLKDRIVIKPKGKLLNWSDFLRKNYGWLHVQEIKMSQAKGRNKINQKAIEAYQSIGKIVVATCAKGPISVAPDALKPPPKVDLKDTKN